MTKFADARSNINVLYLFTYITSYTISYTDLYMCILLTAKTY